MIRTGNQRVEDDISAVGLPRADLRRLQTSVSLLKDQQALLLKQNRVQNSLLRIQKNEMRSALAMTIKYKEQFQGFLNLARACIAVPGGENFIVEQMNPHFQALFPGRSWLGRPAMDAFPYYRVGHIANDNTGLGLGLYICAAVIKRHEDEIEVISMPGKGTSFGFILPVHISSRGQSNC